MLPRFKRKTESQRERETERGRERNRCSSEPNILKHYKGNTHTEFLHSIAKMIHATDNGVHQHPRAMG